MKYLEILICNNYKVSSSQERRDNDKIQIHVLSLFIFITITSYTSVAILVTGDFLNDILRCLKNIW